MTTLNAAYYGAGLPDGVIRRDEMFHIAGGARNQGAALDGSMQYVYSGADRWTLSLTIRVFRPEYPAWNAWITERRSGGVPALIGPEWLIAPTRSDRVTVGFSDGTTFSDGSEFAQGGDQATFAAPVAVGASSCTVDLGDLLPAWQPGLRIGIGGLGLHNILSIVPDEAVLGRAAITFWPPARAAVSAGDNLDAAPVARFRLVDDQQGRMTLPVDVYTDVELEMIEV